MKVERLPVADSWVITPTIHRDERGSFLEWFRGDIVAAETGRSVPVLQANHSVSVRGVIRGIHFADVPPGQAKYVYCASGAVLDVVVDLRVGSPTFGGHAVVELNDEQRCAVLISEGLGHAFRALTDTAEVVYLVSTPYNPAVEHTLSPLDHELAIPWNTSTDEPLRLSARDAEAMSFETALASGVLPRYDACQAFYAATSAVTGN
ncbi:MAG TPA: dTDP-4-dehydrorhamnose 3,5-epimerase [Mycobacteriales bacterium]|nr:dTDP-4-dehydrorhamnose 3,5-epimerase [Mycobacteriales bacterium]